MARYVIHKLHPLARLGLFTALAWRNVWRNPFRSALTLSALAGGMIVLIFYAALMKGMTQQMVVFATEISTGHIQVHRRAFYKERDPYATIPWHWLPNLASAFPELYFSPRAYGSGLASSSHASLGVSIQGVVLDKELRTTRFLSHIKQGGFSVTTDVQAPQLSSLSSVQLSYPPIALGAQLARQLKVGVGDEVVLMTQAMDGSIGHDLYRVAAVFKPLSPDFDRKGVVMHMDDFKNLMVLTSGFHEMVVGTSEPEAVNEIVIALDQALSILTAQSQLDSLGGPVEVRSWKTLTPLVAEMLDVTKAMMLVVAGILGGLAALGMLNTTLMAIHERTHELGVLQAVGMQHSTLVFLLVVEVLFLGAIAIAVGCVLGVLLTLAVGRTGIDFSAALPEGFDWGGIMIEPVVPVALDLSVIFPAASLMVFVTLAAVIVPVRQALKRAPVDLLS